MYIYTYIYVLYRETKGVCVFVEARVNCNARRGERRDENSIERRWCVVLEWPGALMMENLFVRLFLQFRSFFGLENARGYRIEFSIIQYYMIDINREKFFQLEFY